MQRLVLLMIVLLLVLLSCPMSPVSVLAADASRTVIMTTLEWPPYTSRSLPGQGASVLVAQAAFKAVGYTLEVHFYPWNRALLTARENLEVDGYFPEYKSVELERKYFFSDSIGSSPLGFIFGQNSGFHWEKMADLKAYSFGAILGYVNTEEFDGMAAKGDLRVRYAIDDATNIRLVALDRVDAAVIDRHVFRCLQGRPELEFTRGKVNFHPQVLEMKSLHLCFRKDDRGEQLKALFNEGLKRIDVETLQRKYFESNMDTSSRTMLPSP
ncbi:MAG: transporter substrate-binding domain-containing protein [Proteobacteria bacterium]|nr:transporter substrate-binding domain-containing protein [Pseudomonadota bacterium]MBU1612627.1 transporter substrate-binding domain-containing protein [Pseudomonadota bacterium]